MPSPPRPRPELTHGPRRSPLTSILTPSVSPQGTLSPHCPKGRYTLRAAQAAGTWDEVVVSKPGTCSSSSTPAQHGHRPAGGADSRDTCNYGESYSSQIENTDSGKATALRHATKLPCQSSMGGRGLGRPPLGSTVQ